MNNIVILIWKIGVLERFCFQILFSSKIIENFEINFFLNLNKLIKTLV